LKVTGKNNYKNIQHILNYKTETPETDNYCKSKFYRYKIENIKSKQPQYVDLAQY